MMKWIRAGFMSAVMVVMMCGGVFAEGTFVPQGSAVVPAIYIRYANSMTTNLPYITLTNITNETLQVKVSMYDHNGVDISHFGSAYTGSDSANGVPVMSGGAIIELPPHSSRHYAGYNNYAVPKVVLGYATIEWSATDPQLKKAMVATCFHMGTCSSKGIGNRYAERYLINNGQPF